MSRLTIPPNFIGTPSSDVIQATTAAFNDIGIQVNLNGLIDTREGNDTVSGTATGDTSYGINDDGQITLGSGDDSITGTGSFSGIQVSGQGNKAMIRLMSAMVMQHLMVVKVLIP
jgi:hypothetical protein